MSLSRDDELRHGELRFVGSMGAFLSHEIRNGLATINEKSGLLQDMAALAARGREMDMARLDKVAGDIGRLVRRVDLSCAKLSALSHGPDTPRRLVDLSEFLELFTALTGPTVAASGLVLTAEHGDEVDVEIDPVLLQYALFLYVEDALAAGASSVTMRARRTDEGGTVHLSGTEAKPKGEFLNALERLDARLLTTHGGVELCLCRSGNRKEDPS